MSDSLLEIKVDEKTVKRKRREIYDRTIKLSPRIKNGRISSMAPSDIKLIFDLYDQLFFGNWFKERSTCGIEFAISKRMTRSAGMVKCSINKKTGEKNFILR